MTIRTILLAGAAIVAGVGSGAQAFTLHVLHTNDFHSRIEAVNASNSTCSAEDEETGDCFGGAARVHAAIVAKRAELEEAGENVIVLDAGDQFQGSLFFTAYSGGAELEMMNGIGYDAMVVGNHEFDLGPEPLKDFVEGAEFPVIFGNADVSGDNMLAALDRDHVILEVGEERIGILGVVAEDTAETSSPGETIVFDSAEESLARGVLELEAENVNKIIALTHVGVREDIRLAGAVPGVDAIVGGHSHTLFSNSIEGASQPYPLEAPGPDGGTVPIVQAGAYSKYLGHLVLTFDEEGNVTAAAGDTVLLDNTITPDEDILNRIKEMGAPIAELRARKVGEVAADVDGSRETCRAGECAMGNLVAEAILDRVKGQGVTIVIQNGGGLRASIAGGEVTMGDVLAVLPFQNTLSTFNISGAGIIKALENGVSQVEEGAGRFPQVAGLKYTWDPEAPPMQGRIREVLVREGEDWVPINLEKIYAVGTNNFMRSGGDGYAVMRDEGSNAYDFGPGLEEVLADYIAANPGYEPFTDGRITRVE